MKTLIIAEAGKNFIDTTENMSVEYYLSNAMLLADGAKWAGADIVKFQTHVAEDEAVKRHPARREWLEFNESITPFDEFWVPLKDHCDSIGIEFMTTPMSALAAKKVESLVSRWKVGSADVTDLDLLRYVRQKPVFLSTGMSTQRQIVRAVSVVGKKDLTIFHCVSEYPLAFGDALFSLDYMVSALMPMADNVGFSDHTESIVMPLYAINAGAMAIEKHFTISKKSTGPDHAMSLDPKQFKIMVSLIRDFEDALPNNTLRIPTEAEIQLWDKFRYDDNTFSSDK